MQKSWAKKREAEINFAGHVEMTFIDDGDVQTHAKSINNLHKDRSSTRASATHHIF